MNALASALRWDARLQWRYGIVAAALITTLAWGAVLWVTPVDFRAFALPAVLFGDTALFGLYLLPGMVYLERSDGVLNALIVTPIGWRRYLAAQMGPLLAVGMAVGVALAALLIGPASVAWLPLLLGLAVALVFFMLAGFIISSRFDSISQMIFPAAFLLVPAQLPALDYFGLWESPLLWLIPTMAPLVLLRGAVEPLAAWQWVYAVLVSAAALGVAWWWAGRAFRRLSAPGGGQSTRGSEEGRVARRAEVGATVVDANAAGANAGDSNVIDSNAVDASSEGASAGARGLLALASVDLRNLRREPLMAFMALYALVLAVVARLLMPVVAGWIEGRWGVALADYQALVASLFVVLTNPLLLGAVVGLLLLDERDEGSLTALRVTPLGMTRYAAWRSGAPVLLCMAFAFAAGALLAPVLPAPPPPPARLGLVALLAALGTPIAALTVATIASNKVEGLAMVKAMGFLLLGPFAAWWVPFPWRWLFGVLPTWWPTEAYWRMAGEPGSPWPVLIIGFAVHIALLLWLTHRFARNM